MRRVWGRVWDRWADLAAKAALAAVAIGVALGSAQPLRAAEPVAIPILVYHRFDPVQGGPTTVSLMALQGQLDWLSQHGYRIVPLRQALAALDGATQAPGERSAVITVDDGHASVYTVLFPLIRSAKIPVTLFIYPSAISNASYALTWAQLQEMQASGLVDVESHTYWHPNFKTERRPRTPADYEAFVDGQLARSRAVLEKRLGKPVDLLAWPFGVVDADLEAAARRSGYVDALAYSGGPARPGDDSFALPRIPILDVDRGARFAARLATKNHQRAEP